MRNNNRNIRFVIIGMVAIATLAVLAGCQQAEPAAAPSDVNDAAVNAEQPATAPTDAAQAAPTQADSAAEADDLPYAIQLLTPAYHEAYGLFPTDGEWARKYIAIEFEQFTQERVEDMIEGAREPSGPPPAPEFDRGEEFEISKVIRDVGDAEWLVERIRALDADSAETYIAAKTAAERIEVFRTLVEVKGKENGVYEIQVEHGAIQADWSEAQIAEVLANHRASVAETKAISQLTGRAFVERFFENKLCALLMTHVVGAHYLDARSEPGKCDLAKVIDLTKDSLEASGGKLVNTEEYYRNQVEFAAQTPRRQ